ncbi:hypothetical protein GCM10018980_66420 [Streptomyces capoamus]|uniref:Uncharacterized protein n=1 Tax=Streptomyces capoamus TaxID=68183 RepID=A0A919KEZ9_9ACTN|nr:hypothetical protein GCM10010501_55350 [Streptomyces libani subsp. rufus]GHG71289.1 hypothetical protein GCM10018980_66420 [Streptomyces capoamus]
MVSDSRAHGTEAADQLGSSEARQFLSRLSGAFGINGVLMVQKSDPGPEGADLAPSSALRWPRCECGSPKCPDYKAPPSRPTEGLSGRVAEVNAQSRRGGL